MFYREKRKIVACNILVELVDLYSTATVRKGHIRAQKGKISKFLGQEGADQGQRGGSASRDRLKYMSKGIIRCSIGCEIM